jgi:hypothetical protein
MRALAVLGTSAAPAIPELTAIALKTTRPDLYTACRATETLSQLGPKALPAMLNVWSNAANKGFVATMIISNLRSGTNTRDQLDQLPWLLYIMRTEQRAPSLRSIRGSLENHPRLPLKKLDLHCAVGPLGFQLPITIFQFPIFNG